MNMINRCQKTGRFLGFNRKSPLYSIFFPLLGLISLIWFIIRVIPKPSRATYPCQKTAFPLAAAFLSWLAAGAGSLTFFSRRWKKTGAGASLVFLLSLFSVLYIGGNLQSCEQTPIGPSNGSTDESRERTVHLQSFGENENRAIWAYDSNAFQWDGRGDWFAEENAEREYLSDLLDKSLMMLTETDTAELAWESLFKGFNLSYRGIERGYEPGEKVFIKMNSNGFIHPYTIELLLKGLTELARVASEDITIYSDNSLNLSYSGRWEVEEMLENHQILNGVKTLNRGSAQFSSIKVHWSDPSQIYFDSNNTAPIAEDLYLPQELIDADYLINLTSLKGHRLSGFTMAGKNFFGMFQASPHNAGLHPSIAAKYHYYGPAYEQRPMGSYNALVDLIGHSQLGKKTMLILTDALIVSLYQNPPLDLRYTKRFQDEPFDGGWPSSYFLSQNHVAMDSLGLSFLESESSIIELSNNLPLNNYSDSALPEGHTAWNYLEEASSASRAPSGTVYRPDGDHPCGDLGEILHWSYIPTE